MNSLFALDLYASDVMRERLREAAQAALAAQLPRHASPRPDLALRRILATGLLSLATKLDPRGEPALVPMSSR